SRVITLTDNYRSGQAILDQAEAVLPSKSPLVAFGKKAGPLIKVGEFDSPITEYFYLAKDIQSKITAGVEPHEIAVLYRDNRDALPLSAVLRKWGLAVAVESDDDLLSDLDVQKMITVFEALNNFGDNERLARLLHIDFFGLAPLATYSYIRKAYEAKRELIEILKEKEAKLFDQLSLLKVASENMNLLPFMERLLKESKLIEFVITDHKARGRLETIATFFDLAASVVASRPGARLADFLAFLNIAQKHKVLLKKKAGQGYKGKVRLMTTHKAKGLEFDQVYIVGVYDGHFGGRQNRDKLKLLNEVYDLPAESQKAEVLATDDADERRLFYVALTRGKQAVTITYSKIGETGREQVPSRFVTDLRPELVQAIETEKWNSDSKKERAVFLLPESVTESSLRDMQFVAELFHEQGLSVTALNNYLTCPWQYFYRNLIRLPAVPAKHQLYGLAIHGALQDVFAQGKSRGLTKESLLASFQRRLQAQSLTASDFTDSLAKGEEALSGWYDEYDGKFNLNVLTEFQIKGVLLTPDIKLKGNLDKVEFVGTGAEINVVDYKTGQPKSRNQILGETKDADGNYFRQLVFYKLLLDLFEDKKYQMISGEIDFVEPSDSGKYKKEKFEVSEAKVANLKMVIEKVATEILTLSFWDKTCADAKCEYCHLRQLMK
ncbi:MAG: ATP-dependent DNA helicase, partial [Patescibacteria group bacterium]